MRRRWRSSKVSILGRFRSDSLKPFTDIELVKHPDILEVTVVARAHPKWGERAIAFVVLHEHSDYYSPHRHGDFEEELKRFSTKSLPGFARPEWVVVTRELPKTGTGKVLKHVLRDKAAKAKL